MPTADREYNTDAFIENLRYLKAQGSERATLPELTGHDHPTPLGGHPLLNIEALEKRVIDTTPGIKIPLNDDASLTVQKLSGGGMITFRTTF